MPTLGPGRPPGRGQVPGHGPQRPSRNLPPADGRAVYEHKDDAGAIWEKMVELYWPALGIPEEHGGLGMGFIEVAIVAEELGRATVPSPFLATVTQFAPALRELGAGALLAKVAAGEV